MTTTRTKEYEIKKAELQETIMRLEKKRDEYVKRLDDGAVKIEEARGQGKDVTGWETYWIQLLHQYGGVCDKIRDLNSQLKELQQPA